MRPIVLALLAFAGVSAAGFVAVSEEPQVADAQPQQAEAERPRSRIATGSSAPERANAPADDHERLALLSGIVVDEDGEIPEDAQVFIEGEDERFRDLGAPVDPQTGAFELVVPAGEFPLTVEATGYRPLRLDGLAIAPGEELRDLRLTLVRGLTIVGSTFNGEQPAWDAQVVLDGNGVTASTWAEAGTFVFDGLAPGTYRLRALSPEGGSAEVTIAAGEDVDLQLSTREVCGYLEGDLGAAFQPTVQLRQRLEGHEQAEWTCGSDGCTGTPVESGAFCLQVPAHAELAVSAWLEDAEGGTHGFAFDRIRAGERRELRLRFEPLSSVRARLVDGAGQPIDGETVDVLMPGNIADDVAVLTTDETGALELRIPRQPEVELGIPQGSRLVAIDRLPLNAKIVERVGELARHHYLEPSVEW